MAAVAFDRGTRKRNWRGRFQSLQQAQAAIQAAAEEAAKRGWPINIAVLDSGARLVAFARMDGAQLGSIPISQHKARVAVTYRRPSKVFEDAIQKSGSNYLLSLDDIIASRGGIPLVADGQDHRCHRRARCRRPRTDPATCSRPAH